MLNNDLSEMADVIGTVIYSRKMLCTSDSIDLYTAWVFIASQMVQIDVTLLTWGRASLIKLKLYLKLVKVNISNVARSLQALEVFIMPVTICSFQKKIFKTLDRRQQIILIKSVI